MANSSPSTLSSNHAVYGLNAYVDIGGKRAPIISATIEFALNQIPVANVIIPSGIKFDRSGGQSTEGILDTADLQGRKSAKIVITGKGRPHPADVKALPSGDIEEMILFEGYLIAKNVQFGTSSVSTTLTLFHWMSDLDTSSFASGDFAKTSPQDWFDPELPQNPFTNISGLYDGGKYIELQNFIKSDWWQEVIYPVSKFRANQKKNNKFRNPNKVTPNSDLIKSINRMQSGGSLALNEKAKANIQKTNIVPSIHEVFVNVLMRDQGGSSGFEKLVSLAREFKFMLAPRVSTCLVVPYNPVKKVDYTLTEKEFSFGFSSGNPTVVPRGVIIFGASKPIGVFNTSQSKVDTFFLGEYIPDQSEESSGPFFTIKAPAWMHSIVNSQNVIFSGKGPKIGICPDTDPGNGKPPGNNENLVQPPTAFANAFAEAWYFDNLFSARMQEVICGFRTDIGPGDCILLKGDVSGQNVSGASKNWEKRGMVDSVSYLLFGGDAPRINTVYRLRHVFDKSDIEYFKLENGLPHPLFGIKPSITLVQ